MCGSLEWGAVSQATALPATPKGIIFPRSSQGNLESSHSSSAGRQYQVIRRGLTVTSLRQGHSVPDLLALACAPSGVYQKGQFCPLPNADPLNQSLGMGPKNTCVKLYRGFLGTTKFERDVGVNCL
jgi:hypothetical protein